MTEIRVTQLDVKWDQKIVSIEIVWYTSSADYHINKNVLILVARVNGQK